MLPYRVSSLDISATDNAVRGEKSIFKILVNPGLRATLSPHILRVEVTGPSGENLPWYAANITAENATAKYAVHWALNEKPGRYTITVKDTASGIIGRKTLLMK